MEPRKIVQKDELLQRAINHFTKEKNMPDISDKPQIPDEDMCLWLKQKKKSRLKPHSVMRGVCGTWLNSAYDYAISNNLWPVIFKDPRNVQHDLIPECTIAVWIKYVSFMVCIHTLLHVYMHVTVYILTLDF